MVAASLLSSFRRQLQALAIALSTTGSTPPASGTTSACAEILRVIDALQWLSPFSILTGFGLVVEYALLGACWLNWKTEEGLQRQAVTYAGQLGISLLFMIGVISLATVTLEAQYHMRWLSFPGELAIRQNNLLD